MRAGLGRACCSVVIARCGVLPCACRATRCARADGFDVKCNTLRIVAHTGMRSCCRPCDVNAARANVSGT
eukprot:534217-Lingulodinium_polyedra.AAC.1